MTPHEHDLAPWQHAHDFAVDRRATERRAWAVVALTLAMMVLEIGAGWWWNSMALLADGWHMGTHAVAIGVSGVSYWLARRWARDARFSLGPWKIEVLGAYTSAVLLALVAASVTFESVQRLIHPAPVSYDESLVVAALGLVVNFVSAWLLHGGTGTGTAMTTAARTDTAHGARARARGRKRTTACGRARRPRPGSRSTGTGTPPRRSAARPRRRCRRRRPRARATPSGTAAPLPAPAPRPPPRPAAATSTARPPTPTSSPTPPPRCWRSSPWRPASCSAGRCSIRWSACSAPR